MSKSPLYDRAVIEGILPHRHPFLFVDRVLAFDSGKTIIAAMDLKDNDVFFAGHFPGRPIMPGVLVSEALAQTSGLLIGLTQKDQYPAAPKGLNLYLASVNIKFLTPVGPGESLRLVSRLSKEYGGLYLFNVEAFKGDTPVARGTLTLAEEK
jgi:3-hydroxyacyl-[acyl-carrier-protein] dehydratase